MKHILILIFFLQLSSECIAQQEHRISGWGTVGLGLSSFGFDDGDGGVSNNFGFAVRYDNFTLKYKRGAIYEIAIFKSQEQAKSHELLLGYTIDLAPGIDEKHNYSDLFLSFSSGIGELDYLSRGKLLSSTFLNNEYEMNTNSATAFPLEIECEFWVSHYFGISLTAFSTISKFRPVIGSNLCFRLGDL